MWGVATEPLSGGPAGWPGCLGRAGQPALGPWHPALPGCACGPPDVAFPSRSDPAGQPHVMVDYYEALGVSRNATADDIKKA